MILGAEAFQEGLSLGWLNIVDEQSLLPPWLCHLSGVNLSQIDRRLRRTRQTSNATRIDRRVTLFEPLLKNNHFFSQRDPEKAVNDCARLCEPAQNEKRFRSDFLTYLGCGLNSWALLPKYYNACGKWDRAAHQGSKFGRPSRSVSGRQNSGVTPERRKAMTISFLENAEEGMTFVDVFLEALDKSFGVRVREHSDGTNSFYHPEGKWFPSEWVYAYWVKKDIGLSTVQRTLYGQVRTRNRISADVGKETEQFANLMESITADGCFSKERPRGVLANIPLPPLVTVRLYDRVSGLVVGAGFSLGGETEAAYRSACFCMAVDKVWFCKKIFNMDIAARDWPSSGIPPGFGVDRASAAARIVKHLATIVVLRETQPSNQPLSKAGAESGHQRRRKLEGAQSYVLSDLNPFQMARQQIDQVIRDNVSSDASDRMSTKMLAQGVLPTPVGIWTYLAKSLNNDALPMDRNEAIRLFLTKKEFKVKRNGAYLGSMRFDSEAFRKTGLVDKAARSGVFSVHGYVFDLTAHTVWLDVKGQLVELQQRQPHSVGEQETHVSLEELKVTDDAFAERKPLYAEHRRASQLRTELEYKTQTGKPWRSGTRKTGRAKVTADARREAAAIKTFAASPRKQRRAA